MVASPRGAWLRDSPIVDRMRPGGFRDGQVRMPAPRAGSCCPVRPGRVRGSGGRKRRTSMNIPGRDHRAISLDEASRQLELAVHDAQVAYDCIALGNLDRAHTNAVTARVAADAAETLLRSVLGRM